MRRSLAILLLVAVSGCAAPSSGPTAQGVARAAYSANDPKLPIVDLNQSNLALVQQDAQASLAKMGSSAFTGSLLRPGDVIEVTIFDSGEEGLFSSAESKTLSLGKFTVDREGFVNMPFVGRQRAADSTPEGLQGQIVAKLTGSAVNPQAVVTVVDRPGTNFTVNGDVKAAGRFQLNGQRERILDALALAGGPTSAPGETTVMLLRGSKQASVPLERVLSNPAENIYVRPNDQIFVQRDAPSFTAFGAFKSTGEFEFETGKLSLAQAIARAGGLLDDRADPRNVFVFRQEPVAVASALGVGGKQATAVAEKAALVTEYKPVIYKINLKDGSSFFVMQAFQMRDGDVLYASNSKMVDWTKFLTVLQKSPATAAAPLPSSVN